MSVQHTFACDGPDCERHVKTHGPQPPTFLTVTENPGYPHEPIATLHFCGWDCALKYGATIEPEEVSEP